MNKTTYYKYPIPLTKRIYNKILNIALNLFKLEKKKIET